MNSELTESILGYRVRRDCVESCVAEILQSLNEESQCRWLACLNPHSFITARDDADFRAALKGADWLIPDGAGIVLASRILGGRIEERITGPDVFLRLHDRLQELGGYSVFFLGSNEKTLQTICHHMARDWPQVRIAGSYAPPFRAKFSDNEIDSMVSSINSAKPDVLWIGMTAPKQELWIHQVQSRLNVRFAGAVGAIFDFYAGNVKRPHSFFRRLGLEWLPRLLREPRRLWRRTLVSAPVFIWQVLCARISALTSNRQ